MKVVYYLVLATCYTLSLLPLRVLYVIADILYYFLYYIIRYRQHVVQKNLETSFPDKSEAELLAIRHGFYHFFCDYLVESIKLLTIRKEDLRRRLVFKGTHLLDQSINEGQSCAIYLGHYCNWEWVTSLPFWVTPKAQCGQIYHPLENKDFDQLFLRLRQRMGAVCIPMSETLRRLSDYRRQQQPVVIGFISDQVPLWTNIHHWCDFLHHDTPVLTGTERIARKLNYALFYLDIKRVRRGYYEAEIKLITRQPQQSEEFEITDRYFQLLEESIRWAPEYWLWSHNRWKRTHEEFDRRFRIVNGKVVPKAADDSVPSAPYTAG